MFSTEASFITKANPETIWKLWSEVSTWHLWDDGIEAVTLEGPFAAGSAGTLTPKGAPALPYLITEATAYQSFSDKTELPGAELRFMHRLEAIPTGTKITHWVEISGPAWKEYAQGLGQELERYLPKTVARLAQVAEQMEVKV